MSHFRRGRGNNAGEPCRTPTASANEHDYWPLTLYDTREGNLRDSAPGGNANFMTPGGVVQYVELDVNNLRQWILGAGVYAAGTGAQTRNDNGYIVYFSDRRGNRNQAVPQVETGEYGFEDNVNPAVANGTPNDALEAGEDLNTVTGQPVVFDNYGKFGAVIAGALAPYNGGTAAGTARPWLTFDGAQTSGGIPVGRLVGRANRQIFFRRALKIVNGGQNQLPAAGLTIASENPVYVQGNYNSTSNAPPVGEAHVPAAIMADAVTLLSTAWNDIRSFNSPNDLAGRPARTTGYRMAIVGGKTVSVPEAGVEHGR